MVKTFSSLGCLEAFGFWLVAGFHRYRLSNHSSHCYPNDPRMHCVTSGTFHLPRNSGNFGFLFSFHWKMPGNKWDFQKVVLFSRWKRTGGNACSICEFSQGITSSRLFTAISVSPSWMLVTRAWKNGTCVKWNTYFTWWTSPWKFLKVFGKWKAPTILAEF